MHTFELASPKVSICLRFPMQKKGFSLFSQWIVYFSSLIRSVKLFRNYLTNSRFSRRLFKFLIVYEKRCTAFDTPARSLREYFIKFNISGIRRTLMASFKGVCLLLSLNRLLTLFQCCCFLTIAR